ncbi:MAG TPA: succinate dehydrogenase cytochrome b subunit [Bryobacteraceae bacterium]|nr:succinate dehydrogenase cytochrome b subunit [Bryobacteraceae bacterium]
MSTVATRPIRRAVRFYTAPIGKKAVMALTGVILFGYIVGHLLGNLQIYSSDPDQINRYAAFLHSPSNAGLLWGVRLLLLVAVVLHIIASVQLWRLKHAARPIGYVKKDDVPSAYAARTMVWSGPIIAAFVIFHILHLTTGNVVPLRELGPNAPDVRYNLISGFQHPAIAIFYIVAMVLLCMHLYHGLWSMFQSVGISHPRYTPKLKKAAAVCAILILIGEISIPISVMAGLLTY